MDIRPARVDDVPAIHCLIKTQADRQRMILRTEDELYGNLREFFVAETEGRLVGCVAGHIFRPEWAELKCLAVDDAQQGRGVGRVLCEALQQDMLRLGVQQLFALTNAPGFFEKVGYRRIEKDKLPSFIWGECVRCPSFPVCKEEALILEMQIRKFEARNPKQIQSTKF